MSTRLPSSWPIEVKVGASTARIYRRDYRKGEGEYTEFRVAHYLPTGERKFRSFADFDAAKEFAREAAMKMAKGEGASLTLTTTQTVEYQRAVAQLAPLRIELGTAVAEFVAAKTILPDHPLPEAARHYRNTVAPVLDSQITVADAVGQFIDNKRRVGRSGAHLRDLEHRLGRFANRFNCRLSSVTRADVVQWLDELQKDGLAGRSLNNFLAAMSALMEHGRKQGWTVLDLSGVDRFAVKAGDVVIFTVGEWTRILNAARSELVPFLALGGFAGIRAAEIQRMTWGQVRFDTDAHFSHGWIEVRASQSKNAGKLGARARRLIPMQPNLREWLEPYREDDGDAPVCRLAKLEDHLVQLAKTSGVPWKKNGPRHSYGSYRLAQTHDESKVALEMGNSPQMIFAHYRALVSPAQAEEWFNIRPAGEAGNVVPMIGGVA